MQHWVKKSHESRPAAISCSLSDRGPLLGCVKIVMYKHDCLQNVHAS